MNTYWTPAAFLCPRKNGEIGAVGQPDTRPSTPTFLFDSTPLSSARDERSPGARRRSQPTDPLQDRREQRARHRHLGELECDGLRMAHDFRPDLDQLLPKRRQTPVLHLSWQCHLPQEVPEVVSQGEKLQPHLVILEAAAGEPSP